MAANPKTNPPQGDHTAPSNDPVIRSVRGVAGTEQRAAAAEAPWFELPPGQEVRWERFMRFPGPLEAHIVAGRLDAEGVPTVVLSAPAPDLSSSAEVLVPRHLMHRARWVLAWPPASEEELLFLATGEVGPVVGETP